jgi:hypothetical protein
LALFRRKFLFLRLLKKNKKEEQEQDFRIKEQHFKSLLMKPIPSMLLQYSSLSKSLEKEIQILIDILMSLIDPEKFPRRNPFSDSSTKSLSTLNPSLNNSSLSCSPPQQNLLACSPPPSSSTHLPLSCVSKAPAPCVSPPASLQNFALSYNKKIIEEGIERERTIDEDLEEGGEEEEKVEEKEEEGERKKSEREGNCFQCRMF